MCWRFALVLAAVLWPGPTSLAAPQSALASETGITATTIKLGGIIDQTGRGTVVSVPILGGYTLAVKEINATGGINGRKVAYTALSDNYDPSQTLPLTRQLVESDGVFAVMGVFGSDDANVAAPYLESHRVPFFDPVGGGVSVNGKHWIWQTEPDYAREGIVMADFAVTKLHAMRVAMLYQVGIGESQRDAIKRELARKGASLVAVASYQSTDSNLSAQVIQLRSATPDLVILNGTPTPTAAFMQYAHLLAFRPKRGFLANYPMSDPLWLALIGSNAEGNYVSSYADLTGKNRVAKAYRHALAAYHGGKYSNYGLYGYFNATLLFKALKLVGRNLTRTRLRTVLDTRFRNFSTGFTGKLDWTPSQHFGARQFKVYRIHNGQFVPVTGWIKL
jgi:ABC-type branched-subunit amino acid transport system substrate-binding protein